MNRIIKPVKVKSDAFTCYKRMYILILLMVLPAASKASTNRQLNQNNWFVSGNTGIAVRSPDISGNYKFVADGFRHHPGFAFDISFGRTVGKHWEPAFRWGAYTLFGQTILPHYSPVGYYAAYPDALEQEPLEYITQSHSVSITLRFLFAKSKRSQSSSGTIRPFLEGGLGINNFTSDVRYSKTPAGEKSSLIFRDRNGENYNGGSQILTGLGVKIGKQGEWNGVVSINTEWVEFSGLNPVSHFGNLKRSNSTAIVTRVTAGITLPFKKAARKNNYLPFRW